MEITLKEKSEKIFKIVEQIRNIKKNIIADYLILGSMLKEVRDKKLYSSYGSHIKNFDDFIIEVDLKRRSAYNAIEIFERFGESLKGKDVENLNYTKLVALLPVAKDNIEEWIDKANLLPTSALNDEIREAKGKISSDVCQHPEEDQEYFTKCKVCGNWRKASKIK